MAVYVWIGISIVVVIYGIHLIGLIWEKYFKK